VLLDPVEQDLQPALEAPLVGGEPCDPRDALARVGGAAAQRLEVRELARRELRLEVVDEPRTSASPRSRRRSTGSSPPAPTSSSSVACTTSRGRSSAAARPSCSSGSG